MEGWQQILSTFPFMQTLWDALRVIFPMSMLLAFTGIYFISATAKIIGISSKESAYENCARQLAVLGMYLGWILLIGSRLWLYYTKSLHSADTLENFMLELSWMLFSIGIFLSTIYFFLWRPLRNMPILHVTIGMISAVQNTISLGAILFTLRLFAAPDPASPGSLGTPGLFPEHWNSPLWIALATTLPLMFSMAAAYGACWLVARRNKENFGPDYYASMIPWCSAWARNCWLVVWAILLVTNGSEIWNGWSKNALNMEAAIIDGGKIILWLFPLVLWTIASKISAPGRQSWLLFVALVIAACFTIPYYLDISLI